MHRSWAPNLNCDPRPPATCHQRFTVTWLEEIQWNLQISDPSWKNCFPLAMPGILHEVQHTGLCFPVKTREFKTYSPKRGGGTHPMPVSPRGVMPWGYGHKNSGESPGHAGASIGAQQQMWIKRYLVLDVLGLETSPDATMPLELELSNCLWFDLPEHFSQHWRATWHLKLCPIGISRDGADMAEMALGDVMHVTCRVIQSHVLQNGLIPMFDWCQVERTSSNH